MTDLAASAVQGKAEVRRVEIGLQVRAALRVEIAAVRKVTGVRTGAVQIADAKAAGPVGVRSSP